MVLTVVALEAGFDVRRLAFLTAFLDRAGQPFKKSISELAWGPYAWSASDPEHIMELWAGNAGSCPTVRLNSSLKAAGVKSKRLGHRLAPGAQRDSCRALAC
ncbi:TPA: hypothetical protein QDB40_003518 [Burkholderia vietnamiensis]|nr:hypothetical protein [Burkholderia vietnamiensis]